MDLNEPLDRGAVALIDALGFKGIWQRHPAREVLARLKALELAAHEVVDTIQSVDEQLKMEFGIEHRIQMTVLSDTIVVASSARFREGANAAGDWSALCAVTHAVANITSRAGVGSVPLAFRGCISFGDYLIDGHFIVGEAIDRCARGADCPDAAIVWLDEFAGALIDDSRGKAREAADMGVLRNHLVPKHDGTHFNAHVINPFSAVNSGDDAFRRVVLGTFQSKEKDLTTKRRNTERFLDAALAAKRAHGLA